MAEKSFTCYCYRILLLIPFLTALGISSEVTTFVDKSNITVGEKIHFQISLSVPKNTECIPPEPKALFGPITVKDWKLSRSESDQSDTVFIDYILTTYIPENCTIPSLPLIIKSSESTDTLYTESIPIHFVSVITEADSTIDIKELKPQQTAGSAPKWWLWAVGILAGIILLIILVLVLTKKLKKQPLPPPPIPPYEEAIQALGVLHGKRLLEKGLIREYVFELSEIFKRYIERRFSINASEFTTEEMIAWSGISGLDSGLKKSIEWFFRTTDPVKFARIIPDSSIIERFSNEVTTFLEATKPIQNISNSDPENKDTNSPEPVNSYSEESVSKNIEEQ